MKTLMNEERETGRGRRMKLIIDIPEKKYKKIKEYFANDDCGFPNDLAIAKGIPIVQCKECDYWEKSENSLQGRCCLLQMYPTGEWFCGNAKRKENKE